MDLKFDTNKEGLEFVFSGKRINILEPKEMQRNEFEEQVSQIKTKGSLDQMITEEAKNKSFPLYFKV